MSGWWVADLFNQAGGPVLLVSWVVWVIGSIVLHELGHGYAAIWQGDDTPRELGHMNLNPLVHLGTMSLIAFALIGIAWGQMPVRPHNFRSRHGEALVAAAGPLVNVLLAIVAAGGVLLVIVFGSSLPGSSVLPDNLLNFFRLGIALNIALVLFNLLPVPPLDGSRILGDLVPSFNRLWQGDHAQWAGLAVFAGIFFFGGSLLFGTGFTVADWVIDQMIVITRGP